MIYEGDRLLERGTLWRAWLRY